MSIESRKALRKTLRAKRAAVSPAQRRIASRLVAKHVDHAFHLYTGQRIALYNSLPEELDTSPLMQLARARGCRIYLPRIERRTWRMRFVRANEQTSRNHLGIIEPKGTAFVPARWLDIVFMPLVGFDAYGMRLGMGGGFYDRAFAFRRWRSAWRGPRLVGIAYDLQRLEAIAPAPHDVRLDAVVTEKGIIQCAIG